MLAIAETTVILQCADGPRIAAGAGGLLDDRTLAHDDDPKDLDRLSTQGIRTSALARWELMNQFELRSRSTRVHYRLRR